jgi:ABC-2 type transport system permease protein
LNSTRTVFWPVVAVLWRRELIRFWRERARVLGFVGSPLVFWLAVGSGFGDLAFFFPGALTMTVMFSAVFSTMSVIEDRREGFLLAVLASPASRCGLVMGKILGSSTLAWIQGMVFLAFAPLARVRLNLTELLAVAVVLALTAITFTALGFFFAWRMESTQGFHAVINLLLVPLWLVSGAVFPITNAHAWMQVLMTVNPMMYALAALRETLAPGAGGPALALSIAVTTGCALVFLAASVSTATRKPAGGIA